MQNLKLQDPSTTGAARTDAGQPSHGSPTMLSAATSAVGGGAIQRKISRRRSEGVVQRKADGGQQQKKPVDPPWLMAVQARMNDWALVDQIKRPIVQQLARDYLAWKTINDLPALKPPMTEKQFLAREPSEAEVVKVVDQLVDLHKTGFGNTAADWQWHVQAPVDKPKGTEEKGEETMGFVLDETVGAIRDKLIEDAARATVKWVGNELLSTVVVGALDAWNPVGWILLAYSVVQLLESLQENTARSPIVEGFMAFLEFRSGKSSFTPPPLINKLETDNLRRG